MGLRVSVKMVGPVSQATDLQIICLLKHNTAGDAYLAAMKELDSKLGGVISKLRDDGDFVGERGETLLFTPPKGTIAPKRMLLVGVGDEAALSLENMRLVGRIAVREAVRLGVSHVSFAPTLRDQGSKRLDVGDGDAAMVEQFLMAYGTEKQLQRSGLSPKDILTELTIEAGGRFFDDAVKKVSAAVGTAAAKLKVRAAPSGGTN